LDYFPDIVIDWHFKLLEKPKSKANKEQKIKENWQFTFEKVRNQI